MRTSGILMHISSLEGDYGIGTLGKEAYQFVDFLSAAGQSLWQILPVCPTSYGDSPYQSFSTFAGNPYFIDLEMLEEEGLLKKSDYQKINWGTNCEKVDYALLYKKRFPVLKKAYENFKKGNMAEFYRFEQENEKWISNYGLFMTIKDKNKGNAWFEWEQPLKQRDPHALWLFKTEHEDEVRFWEFIQYLFYKQWAALKDYANGKGIRIIGDIPIYVAGDSADVWVSPDLFDLDEECNPRHVAGCPPDGFSPTGQLWGNPVYRWERMRETGYVWWIERMRAAAKTYDIIRIDHFRGFESFFSIPAEDETAEYGAWERGPGLELFEVLKRELGELPIIAEDLGFLTDSVRKMLKDSGYPGMKVLEFAFEPEGDSDYLPHNYEKNCVVYPGTHDNDTIAGWLKSLTPEEKAFCKKYLSIKTDKSFVWEFIRAVHASVADMAIVQMQDYLELGSDARMNIPSTLGGNWEWRIKPGSLTKELAERIFSLTKLYRRQPQNAGL